MTDHRFEVIVAGAGIAGVAAAVESARRGRRTALVEKTIFAGGLATSGLIYVYLPICDGFGTQLTFGLAEELLHLSLRYGPGDVPDWKNARGGAERERYCVVFSPASFTLALDELLTDSGVTLLLDALAVDVVMDGSRAAGLDVETKSGRARLLADCVIDATGDADVAFRAGAECATGDNWLSIWALMASLDAAKEAADANRGTPLLDMKMLGAWNAGRNAPPGSGTFDGTVGDDVTRFALEGRKLLREDLRRRYAEGADRRDLYPLTLPAMAQFRTTRRIVGRTTLTDGDATARFDDSIGLLGDWRKAGPVWEVPFGTLVPKGISGLLSAGRCISSADDAWEITRVIPGAALTGQVAGLAAALAVERRTTPDALDVGRIQKHLRELGLPLHRDELKGNP